jgi:hypothetical protein
MIYARYSLCDTKICTNVTLFFQENLLPSETAPSTLALSSTKSSSQHHASQKFTQELELGNEGGDYSNEDIAVAIEHSMESQQVHAAKYGNMTYEQREEAELMEAINLSIAEDSGTGAKETMAIAEFSSHISNQDNFNDFFEGALLDDDQQLALAIEASLRESVTY